MGKARLLIAWMAGACIFFGAVLVALGITGSLDWRGSLLGSSFEVSSTHIGVAFALVGLTLGLTVLLRPPMTKTTFRAKTESGDCAVLAERARALLKDPSVPVELRHILTNMLEDLNAGRLTPEAKAFLEIPRKSVEIEYRSTTRSEMRTQ